MPTVSISLEALGHDIPLGAFVIELNVEGDKLSGAPLR